MENIIEKLWSRFLQEKTQKVPKNSQTNPLGLRSPKYFHYEHFIQTNKFMNTNISTNKFGEYFLRSYPGQFSPDKTFEKNDFIYNLSTSEDEKEEEFIDLWNTNYNNDLKSMHFNGDLESDLDSEEEILEENMIVDDDYSSLQEKNEINKINMDARPVENHHSTKVMILLSIVIFKQQNSHL